MKKYDYEKIQKLLNPIFEFMQTEYPNNYCLVINSNSAELKHNQSELIFLDKPLSKGLEETANGNFMQNIFKAVLDNKDKQNSESEVKNNERV